MTPDVTTNTTPNESVSSWTHVEDFLRDRGADRIPHPGGTLLAHLSRVARLLGRWGANRDVQAAGLCHAAYGTDGFDESLLRTTDRATLAGLIGERAEALVHLYGSCDRGALYPQLGRVRPVVFRDRFTGGEHTPSDADLRAFVEITAANELHVLAGARARRADRRVLTEKISRRKSRESRPRPRPPTPGR